MQLAWLAEVTIGYSTNPVAVQLLQKLSLNPNAQPPYTLVSGVIRYMNRIWLGNNQQLQLRVIAALHDSALGGHSGFPVTHSRIKKLIAWKGMKSAIKSYVASCSVCLPAKPDRVKYLGLLSPLPVPTELWQIVSMDFIDGLHLAMQIVSWWWSTNLVSMLILFLCTTHILLKR